MSTKTNRHKLLQNWTNYNESIIWDITHQYYQNKGVSAFSKQSNNLIPNDITTNYQSALAFAHLVKSVIDNSEQSEKHKVLEVGAGSGYFSRNFLYACQDLGILDRIEFYISDYSVKNLQEIKALDMLKDFNEGEHYHFIELDVTDFSTAKKLNGNSIELNNLTGTILNYVLDVLPATALKHKGNKTGKDFEELQMRVFKHVAEDDNVIENSRFLSNLHKETRWVNYDFDKEPNQEKDFAPYFTEYYENTIPQGEVIVYHYGSMQACKNILEHSNENGFFITSDIPAGKTGVCQVVGNALAHEVENQFIGFFMEKLGYKSHEYIDKFLSRLLCFKQDASNELLNTFNQVYKDENKINRYCDIRSALNDFKHKESMDCMAMLLEKFEDVAKYSIYPFIYWGNYYNTLGERDKAIEEYKKASEIDFLNNYNLDIMIENLSKL